ncbi:hypothetical protein [Actinopolyspora halophila]|uniref:hypothetical protein n=1 Tax=Actinopolyspora halophila TaxID=1850 RepID=UPI00036EB033|nr:hypothetical protein [Actinopolyspora halophila]
MMRHPDTAWGLWWVAVLVSFTVLERQALGVPTGGYTLTATTKRWLGIHPAHPVHRTLGMAVLTGAAVWTAMHLYGPDTKHPGCVWCAS